MRFSPRYLLLATSLLAGCAQQASSTIPAQGAYDAAPAPQAAAPALAPRKSTYGFYSFRGGSDGSGPRAGLVLVNGVLYGTTFYGGSSGQGTVYEIDSKGEKVLHSFKGGSDGANPSGDLLYYNGSLYGTTPNGGSGGTGTVFAVNLKGKEHVVYSFGGIGGTDADGPTGGLVEAGGVLYGVAPQGGASGYGAVFAVTPSGSEHIVYSFGLSGSNFGGDAYSPTATLAYANGVLYGTSYYGGANNIGAVFAVTPSGSEHVVYSFAGNTDGALPSAGVIAAPNGELYGTTTNGGCGPSSCGSTQCQAEASSGCGTVFAVNASTGAETVLHRFQYSSSDGANPLSGLVQVKNVLYGTASIAGATGNGAVFKIETNGKKEGLIHSFKGGPSDGATPQARLLDAAGLLYGTTNGGGQDEDGIVFDLTP